MPRATVDLTETQLFDLKSLSEGFVKLKRLSYGQVVERRSMLKLSIESSGKSKDFRGEMAMASKEVQKFEFVNAIVDHNLEDANGTKLDFNKPVDFETLDPRVGQEIEKLITEMNDLEGTEEN